MRRMYLTLFLINIVFSYHQNDEFQRYDGRYNNFADGSWGCVGSRLYRDTQPYYEDGVYQINQSLPSPRSLSNLISDGQSGLPNDKRINTLFAFFSQVVFYEIINTDGSSCPLETVHIPVPKCDPIFDKECQGKTTIPIIRSKYDKTTGNGINSPREQINQVTHFIDASFIYGTQEPWVASLRSFKKGNLAESEPGYPQFNKKHIPLDNPIPPNYHRSLNQERLFMLGDSRVNENPGLLSIAIILFRWHNYQADRIRSQNIDWTDEQIFQKARRFVIASLQKIIIYDYVPILIGTHLDPYTKYEPRVSPAISHAFSTAAFQFTHSIIPSAMFLRKRGKKCEFRKNIGGYDAIRLCQNWWNSQNIVDKYNVEEIIFGMISQISEKADTIVVDDLRDHFYGPTHFSRIDAVALTIMRGRDNGLSPYNILRKTFGLEPKTWETINQQFYKKYPQKIEELKQLYSGNIDLLDAYIGGMIEGDDNGPGQLFTTIIKHQFERIRDGDRFWFENRLNDIFDDEQIEQIRNVTFYDIIRATTDIDETMLQKDVFHSQPGDPCPQPFQINNTYLEPCSPFQQTSYWTHDDIVYIFTLIGLICVPIICFGIGRYLIIRRRSLGSQQTNYNLTTISQSENNQNVDFYETTAREYLEKDRVRNICIEIMNSTLILKWPRGRVLRELRFEEGQNIRIVHSFPQSTKQLVMICWTQNKNILLQLKSDQHLEQFLNHITNAVHCMNAQIEAIAEENSVILEQNVSEETRQQQLASFFREAYVKGLNVTNGTWTYTENEEMSERITREELASAMGMKQNDIFVRRLFALTAQQNEDSISFREFFESLSQFTNGSSITKFQLLFRMCDTDRCGQILRKDFEDLIRSLNRKAGIAIDRSKENDVIKSVLRKRGIDMENEYMTLEEFNEIFAGFQDDRRPHGYPINLNQPTSDNTSLNSFHVDQRNTENNNFMKKLTSFLETYRQHTFILVLFFSTNIVLFAERFWHYSYMTEHRDLRRVMGSGIAFTRGAAGALTFDMAVILLTVCRNLITTFRQSVLSQFIPFDSAIGFHKIIAYTILVLASIHTIGHCINFYHIGTQSPASLSCLFQEAVFGSNISPNIGKWFFNTVTGVTGLALVIVISIIYSFAMPSIIRNAYHAFRLTHLLNIAFYALTILHGLPKLLDSPKFGYVVLLPILLFVIDRIIGLMAHYKGLKMIKAEILPSDIIFIEFERPRFFIFKSGQWLTISSPTIDCCFNKSHAFSIASSPQDRTVKLYIKSVGPWTWNLRNEIIRAHRSNSSYPMIHLKGPYGDGNQEWMNYEVAVMIGGGIGVTPYASTLNDLVQLTSQKSFNGVQCKKVYFLWICPSHKNYEWFVDVLKEVEMKDEQRILETHIFVTQIFSKFDLRTTMLHICEKHFRETETSGVSMFTGLRAQNHFSRPDFNSIFSWIANKHADQQEIGVFSCGPNNLNEKISESCSNRNCNEGPSFSHRFETF